MIEREESGDRGSLHRRWVRGGSGWVAECLKSTTQRNPTDEGNVGVEARSEVRHNKLTSVLLLTENKINAESNRRCSMTLGGGTVS